MARKSAYEYPYNQLQILLNIELADVTGYPLGFRALYRAIKNRDFLNFKRYPQYKKEITGLLEEIYYLDNFPYGEGDEEIGGELLDVYEEEREIFFKEPNCYMTIISPPDFIPIEAKTIESFMTLKGALKHFLDYEFIEFDEKKYYNTEKGIRRLIELFALFENLHIAYRLSFKKIKKGDWRAPALKSYLDKEKENAERKIELVKAYIKIIGDIKNDPIKLTAQ